MRPSTPLAALAALAIGSVAFTPVDASTLAAETVYFHCGDTQKVANVEGGLPFGWDGEAPTGSVTQGDGCGQLDMFENQDDGISFEGTFTGLLDSFTIQTWVIDAPAARAGLFAEIYVNAEVLIDEGRAGEVFGELQIPVQRSESGASALLEFTVTDVGLLDDQLDAGEHTISIRLETADYANGDALAWVLDTSEVPAGIVFNPETPATLTASAN